MSGGNPTADPVAGLAQTVFTDLGEQWVIHSHVDEQGRWWLRVTNGSKWYQTLVSQALVQLITSKTKHITADKFKDHVAGKLSEGMMHAKFGGNSCVLSVQDDYSFTLEELKKDGADSANRDFIFSVAAACAKRGAKIGNIDRDDEILKLTNELSAIRSQRQQQQQQQQNLSLSQHTIVAPVGGSPGGGFNGGVQPGVPDIVVASKRTAKQAVHAVKRKAGASIINPWTKSVQSTNHPEFEEDDD